MPVAPIEETGNDPARAFWKRLQVILLICTFGIAVCWYSLWEHYVLTRPRTIDGTQGRVIPLSSHGIIVYLTQEEKDRLKLLDIAGTGVLLSMIVVHVLKRPFK
jgi:hypothetical protein